MAKLLSVLFPSKLLNSLAQLGRLDPQGRLIMDDCTREGGLKPARELEGVHFQPIDLGYLGKFSVITCDGTRVLEPAAKANGLLKALEKQMAQKMAECEAALKTLEPAVSESAEFAEAA